MNNHEQAPSTNDNPSWENLSDVEPRFEVQNRVAEKFKSGKAKETLMRALKATLLAAGVAATVFMSKGEAPANNAPTAISQEVEPKGDDTNAGDFVEPMGLTEETDNAIEPAFHPETPPPEPKLPETLSPGDDLAPQTLEEHVHPIADHELPSNKETPDIQGEDTNTLSPPEYIEGTFTRDTPSEEMGTWQEGPVKGPLD